MFVVAVGFYAWNGTHIIDQLPFVGRKVFGFDIRRWKSEVANSNPALAYSWIQCQQIAIAAHKEQCAHEKHHGDGDLGNHHSALYRESFAVANHSPFAGFQRRKWLCTGAPESRERAEDDTSRGGGCRRKKEHAPVRYDREVNHVLTGVERVYQRPAERLREGSA